MLFLAMVVLPIGVTAGAVAWTLFRQGGFGSFLMSVMLATMGAIVGFYAAPAIIGSDPTPGSSGLGAAVGALLIATLETIVRWHSPRGLNDRASHAGASSPIEDPRLGNIDDRSGRDDRRSLRPPRVRGSEA